MDYSDIELLALETKINSVTFGIAPKYSILDSFVDYDIWCAEKCDYLGPAISEEGLFSLRPFLLTLPSEWLQLVTLDPTRMTGLYRQESGVDPHVYQSPTHTKIPGHRLHLLSSFHVDHLLG